MQSACAITRTRESEVVEISQYCIFILTKCTIDQQIRTCCGSGCKMTRTKQFFVIFMDQLKMMAFLPRAGTIEWHFNEEKSISIYRCVQLFECGILGKCAIFCIKFCGPPV